MPIEPCTSFIWRAKRYARCTICGQVGREDWAHAHAKDVDGHVYGVNWYRSVAELEAKLAESNIPPGTIVRGGT